MDGCPLMAVAGVGAEIRAADARRRDTSELEFAAVQRVAGRRLLVGAFAAAGRAGLLEGKRRAGRAAVAEGREGRLAPVRRARREGDFAERRAAIAAHAPAERAGCVAELVRVGRRGAARVIGAARDRRFLLVPGVAEVEVRAEGEALVSIQVL